MKSINIRKENRGATATAVRKIIFFLREGKSQNEAISQALAGCSTEETRLTIRQLEENAQEFSSGERQLHFWGTMLQMVTQG